MMKGEIIMKRMFSALCFLLVFSFLFVGCVQKKQTTNDTTEIKSGSDGLAYKVREDGTTCTITGMGTCTDTAVVIPPKYDGYTVEVIGRAAFAEQSTLTSVLLADTVKTIGFASFRECTNLISVLIPNSVTIIGDRSFEVCTNLTSVLIPDSVTTIGSDAFSHCTGLTSVTISASVTSIGTSVFAHCTGLTSVTIPDSVTSIGRYSFKDCTSLTSITIPAFVTSVGRMAFANCSSLTSIQFQGTKAQWNAISKSADWDSQTGNYVVHCTDGDIAK